MVNDELITAAEKNEERFIKYEAQFNVSAISGIGLDGLFARLADFAENFLAGSEPALIARERQRRALQEAQEALRRAVAPGLNGREELLVEELRLAARALGRLIGQVDVEDILDVIFRDFCIGK
jgi:tRNA modification GTPase